MVASLRGREVAAGAAARSSTAAGESTATRDGTAPGDGNDIADAVLAVLSWLQPPGGRAQLCLPGAHPAVRPLLQAGWRIKEFDLHMSSEPGLFDPRGPVPSCGLA